MLAVAIAIDVANVGTEQHRPSAAVCLAMSRRRGQPGRRFQWVEELPLVDLPLADSDGPTASAVGEAADAANVSRVPFFKRMLRVLLVRTPFVLIWETTPR